MNQVKSIHVKEERKKRKNCFEIVPKLADPTTNLFIGKLQPEGK